MLKFLERYFEFTHLGTNWRTEILAGVTTFLTMAYIVLVNPAILATAGVPLPAVTAATPGMPVRRETASAAKTAVASWRTSMMRMPRALAPTRMGEM